jgi:hypothetical protein
VGSLKSQRSFGVAGDQSLEASALPGNTEAAIVAMALV